MFSKLSRRGVVVLLGTLALARCSGGNDIVGNSTGRLASTQTPTAVSATPVARPTPGVMPTPRPCPPKLGDNCPDL
jgi:hypothetical protein